MRQRNGQEGEDNVVVDDDTLSIAHGDYFLRQHGFDPLGNPLEEDESAREQHEFDLVINSALERVPYDPLKSLRRQGVVQLIHR